MQSKQKKHAKKQSAGDVNPYHRLLTVSGPIKRLILLMINLPDRFRSNHGYIYHERLEKDSSHALHELKAIVLVTPKFTVVARMRLRKSSGGLLRFRDL